MTNKVNELPLSPLEESPPRDELSNRGENPEINYCTSLEKEVNILTQGDLDHLRESCSFLSGLQARLPEEDETILSTL